MTDDLRLPHQPGRWPLATNLTAQWLSRDGGRPPREPANPAFPNGMDLNLAGGAKGCAVELPYVENRIGLYAIECSNCGLRVAVTVAGRPDDPLVARIACKVAEN